MRPLSKGDNVREKRRRNEAKPLKMAFRNFCLTDRHRDKPSYRDERTHLKIEKNRVESRFKNQECEKIDFMTDDVISGPGACESRNDCRLDETF